MKSMFDNYFGGRISSRAQMQERIRNMEVTTTVMQETENAINSRSAADSVEALAKFNKERKWKIIQDTKSAPYCGERY